MRHLLRSWGEVRGRIAGRSLSLFFDYDGTLVPIAETPAGASLPRRTRALLRRLSAAPGVRVAVISGRALEDVKRRVGLRGIAYAGTHGMELEGPGIARSRFAPRDGLAALARIREEVSRAVERIPGALVEDKGCAFALHYRAVAARKRPLLKALFRAAASVPLSRGVVRIQRGKMVSELLPAAGRDKGKAVLRLAARQRALPGAGRPVLIYVGDDATDEDAFGALKGRGLTVRVGRPRRSLARYYLRDTREVAGFLARVLDERSRTPCPRSPGRRSRSGSTRASTSRS